jgi:hypothetical protein
MRCEYVISNRFAGDLVGPVVPVVQSFECSLNVVQVTFDCGEIERVRTFDVGRSRSEVMLARCDRRRWWLRMGGVLNRAFRVLYRL